MEITPIARFSSPLSSKFGLPRQSGLASALQGRIVLEPEYRRSEALEGLSDFSHLWLVWGFSENVDRPKHPTVRPPRLGGNKRLGVFATRSSFRPNNLGLSSVRIVSIAPDCSIVVAGADLMDGTPIYDIKPYVPFTDCHPDARGGFTDTNAWQRLEVDLPAAVAALFTPAEAEALREVLAEDPRPQYHHSPERVYGMPFAGRDVRFTVDGRRLTVVDAPRL